MNFIPVKSEPNGNYLCTWALQSTNAKKLGIKGKGGSSERDALNTELLFNSEEYYHVYPNEYRGGLYFLLDDGWDVPYGTTNAGDDLLRFGTLEPDPEKFKELGNTSEERLKEMSRRVKELGYAGLALWVSPQKPFVDKSEQFDMTSARKYWEEKAKESEAAGITYWKVDWGAHGGDVPYRMMMTECVHKFAPNLRIEHAVGGIPYSVLKADSPKVVNMRKILPYSDYFRTYDVAKPFDLSETLCRLNWLLSENDYTMQGGSVGKINVETCAYIAAALGFNLGIMRHNRETEAALRWQRIAPPFSVADGKYTHSEEVLTDNLYFEHSPVFWIPNAANTTAVMSAPAVMARNTALPNVTSKSGEKPFVIASSNPETGAYSIAAIRRNIDPNPMIAVSADVTAYPERMDAPIGVFGTFGSLTLSFKEEIPQDAKVYAQFMLANEAADITEQVKISGNTVTLDGKDIRRFGKDKIDFNHVEEFDPALLIKIV